MEKRFIFAYHGYYNLVQRNVYLTLLIIKQLGGPMLSRNQMTTIDTCKENRLTQMSKDFVGWRTCPWYMQNGLVPVIRLR